MDEVIFNSITSLFSPLYPGRPFICDLCKETKQRRECSRGIIDFVRQVIGNAVRCHTPCWLVAAARITIVIGWHGARDWENESGSTIIERSVMGPEGNHATFHLKTMGNVLHSRACFCHWSNLNFEVVKLFGSEFEEIQAVDNNVLVGVFLYYVW